MNESSTHGKTITGALAALLVGMVMLGLVTEAALRLLYPNWAEFDAVRFLQPQFTPGHPVYFVGKPGFDGYFTQNNGDFRHHIRINAAGLRDDEPVSMAHHRIWMVGDSMTFGWGVERPRTFTAEVGRLTGLPTYNVAGPGGDVCSYQAFIDRMPPDAKPLAVVLGLVIENDMNLYDCQAQAQAALKNHSLSLNPNFDSLASAKVTLRRYSAVYNVLAVSLKRVPWMIDFLINAGLIERAHVVRNVFSDAETPERIRTTMVEIVKIRDKLGSETPFAVAIMPARFEVRDDHPYFRKMRIGIARALSASGIETIDLLPPFKRLGFRDTHFRHDGHWSVKGHALAAETIADWIQNKNIAVSELK